MAPQCSCSLYIRVFADVLAGTPPCRRSDPPCRRGSAVRRPAQGLQVHRPPLGPLAAGPPSRAASRASAGDNSGATTVLALGEEGRTAELMGKPVISSGRSLLLSQILTAGTLESRQSWVSG